MALFSKAQIAQINKVAEKSKQLMEPAPSVKPKSITKQIDEMSRNVVEYFKDSPAILITTKEELHDYVTKCIESGYAGIDTETTGLDRSKDYVVGSSLYYPGGVEAYIPNRHRIPIFEEPYKHQLSYEEVQEEFQRFVDAGTKMIFANADFDLAMIYKDLKVDMTDICYFDVILAWRCLKENELHNDLKSLYNKYCLKGKGDPKKFSDFFSPELFPYCKPEVAKLYAANDAKITFELFKFELPYLTKSNQKCQRSHLEKIADLVWNIEFPMMKVCAMMHRCGIYLDTDTASALHERYTSKHELAKVKLAELVQELIDSEDTPNNSKRPFRTGKDFNPNSPPQVKYLIETLLKAPPGNGTGKEVLNEINKPSTKQILTVRGFVKLLSTYVDKLPKATTSDSRIHATFKSVGADTGRMCIAEGTKITCLNGEKFIQDIVPGDLVYCYDESGILQLKPVKNLWKTGIDRDCIRIRWQSSGKGDIGELVCTPEHPILLKSGEWVRADSLKRYTKLAHLRRTVPSSGEKRPQLYGWNGLATREQDVVKYSIFHESSEMVIHHKDNNKANNDLSNLEIMTVADHISYHTKNLQSSGKLSAQPLHTPEARKKKCINQAEAFRQRCISQRDDLLECIRRYKGRITAIPGDFQSFKKRCELAGINLYKEAAKYNYQYLSKAITKEEFLASYIKFKGDYKQICNDLDISYTAYYTLYHKYEGSLNHRVQSIESAGKHVVYDIEVEGIHNFIANEICVHNSSADPNMQNIPSHATDIRHMFRATSEQIEKIQVDAEDNVIEFAISAVDSVLTSEGFKLATELNIGDILDTTKDKIKSLLSITNLDNCDGKVLITCVAS